MTKLIRNNLRYNFISNQDKVYKDYLVGKARMKNIPKKSMHMKSTMIGEIIFIDRLLVKNQKRKRLK
jgi:hypothetical protein